VRKALGQTILLAGGFLLLEPVDRIVCTAGGSVQSFTAE